VFNIYVYLRSSVDFKNLNLRISSPLETRPSPLLYQAVLVC